MDSAIEIAVNDQGSVPARLVEGDKERALIVLAPGAGMTIEHEFMVEAAELLAERGISTLRFNFPYMQTLSRQPNTPTVLYRTVRDAVAFGRKMKPAVPLFAGGRAFGARITSEAQAREPLAGVDGLVFMGYALHRASAPSIARATHLYRIKVPMLFVQGTLDEVAHPDLIREIATNMTGRIETRWIEEADQSFRVSKPERGGDRRRTREVVAHVADWVDMATGSALDREDVRDAA